MQHEGRAEQRAWVMAAVEQYEQRLVRFTTRLLRDEHAARDVVQHTFLRLCRQTPGELDARLPQWLFTVCRNRAVDLLRTRGRLVSLESDGYAEPTNTDEDPSHVLAQRDLGRSLLALVENLPDSQREVLLLWLEGWTGPQIAEITGRGHSTVRVHLHKSLTWLRQHPAVRRLQDETTTTDQKSATK